MSEWFSIEVIDGTGAASHWLDAYVGALYTAAYFEQASDWETHRFDWGVVVEVELPDELAWERFRELPAVRAALDALPPTISVIAGRGRGGASGARSPRRPRPVCGAGAIELPLPVESFWVEPDPPIVLSV